jgi:hypothetical protein
MENQAVAVMLEAQNQVVRQLHQVTAERNGLRQTVARLIDERAQHEKTLVENRNLRAVVRKYAGDNTNLQAALKAAEAAKDVAEAARVGERAGRLQAEARLADESQATGAALFETETYCADRIREERLRTQVAEDSHKEATEHICRLQKRIRRLRKQRDGLQENLYRTKDSLQVERDLNADLLDQLRQSE